MKIGDLVVLNFPYLRTGLVVLDSSWFQNNSYWWVLFSDDKNIEWRAEEELDIINEI